MNAVHITRKTIVVDVVVNGCFSSRKYRGLGGAQNRSRTEQVPKETQVQMKNLLVALQEADSDRFGLERLGSTQLLVVPSCPDWIASFFRP